MATTPGPRRVLIVGASGFLGSNLAVTASARNKVIGHSSHHPVMARDITAVVDDLTVTDGAARLIDRARPELVVNCAALADVDACERDPEAAHRLNATLAADLASACARHDVDLVHVSTDAVFGASPGPYTVESPPSPLNEYGRSKLAGEMAVREAHPSAMILRTNIVGWSPTGRRSLLEYFWNRLSAGQTAPGFHDVQFRPVAAGDLWPMLLAWLYEPGLTGGIRHATGTTLLSKFDFGRAVAEAFGFDPSLVERSSVALAGLTSTRAPSMDVVPSPPPAAATVGQDGWPAPGVHAALQRLKDLADHGHRARLADFVSRAVERSN
jgi:dTDP-4-dehydrorhamnose reductase